MRITDPAHLELLFPGADHQRVLHLLKQKHDWLGQPKKGFLRYRQPLESVSHLRARYLDFDNDAIVIGREDEISAEARNNLRKALRAFMPWRKGPWNIFGVEVDAEWRSERKWNRLRSWIPDLRDKMVGDIGCNNGYYMFRMLPGAPRFILGFEPHPQHYFAFQLLNSMAAQEVLDVEPLGIEHLSLFPDCFDVLFCLGILYHRKSPIQALEDIHCALKAEGTLLVESQAIPGDEPVALFPQQTYAKVPGTWFVPTAPCLENWLNRTGFREVRCFCSHPMSSAEQRRTRWMEYESYDDFIDASDPTRTKEGYPAPIRVFFRAKK